ncbi:hypothetical protein GCM10018790_64670 [Kitasatospora xanthocidica]|nr:hypothetical protein GCM10018790_64670 [Kitasatospora xanthocidica]
MGALLGAVAAPFELLLEVELEHAVEPVASSTATAVAVTEVRIRMIPPGTGVVCE